MEKRTIPSRRIFFRTIAGLTTGLVLWLWHKITENNESIYSNQEFRHSEDLPSGVTHFGKYFLYRSENSVVAFSTTCTHAGCRLGKTTSRTIPCSCHGSLFDASTGIPVKGPAIKPLTRLTCDLDPATRQWIVKWQQTEV